MFTSLLFAACMGVIPDDASSLDPDADSDGDGFLNSEEAAAGSDPLDAGDIPLTGGWAKGDCEVDPSGDAVGEVAADFSATDQFGETIHLHDFCQRSILLEFSGFT